MTLKLLDTFAGIGGFSYAAEQLLGGFKTTQFVEIEPYCQKVLKKHWPNVPIHDDIKTFTAKPFQYDCIAGGFPCQDVSVAGQQRGITKETRSGLFYELIRIIRMVRPKYVLLENVAALLNNGMGIVLGELSEIGYDVEWKVISARERGACHLRQRVWIIAYPKGGRRRGGSSQECSIQERQLLPGEQGRGEMGSEVKGCGYSTSNTNDNGQQGGESKTRNQNVAGQNSQVKWSANTENIERHNNDGSDTEEPGTDGIIQGSSDGGTSISSNTGGVCKLSEDTNDNKKTSRKNKYKEDNNRTLVSQGQEGIQLSFHTTLAGDQTTFENNTVRHGNDHSTKQGMEHQESDITHTKSEGLERQDRGLQDKGLRTNIARHSRPVANSQHNGSFTSEESRSIEESDGRATQGENKACEFKGSSKPGDSRALQHNEKFANTKGGRGNGGKFNNNTEQGEEKGNVGGCDSTDVTNSNKSGSREGGISEHIGNKGWETCEGGTESVQSKDREARSSNFGQSNRDESTNSLHEGSQGFRGERELPEGGRKRQIIWRSQPHTLNPNWRGYISKPTLRRRDDGLSNRVDRLKALGNSIVPQVATIPLGRILDLEKENQ